MVFLAIGVCLSSLLPLSCHVWNAGHGKGQQGLCVFIPGEMITELCSAGHFFPQPVEKGGLELSQMGLLLAKPFSGSLSTQ